MIEFGESKIIRPISFNPAEFIGKGYSIWRGPVDGNGLEGDEEQDVRSLSLTEVDFTKVFFNNAINKNWDLITGEEKLKRLKSSGCILIDFRFGAALYNESYQPTLNWLRIDRGITRFYFSGTTFRDRNGCRCMVFFDFFSLVHRWLLVDIKLDNSSWLFYGPSAVLAS